ncbi:unknown [Clostridium sp. CAG:1193]|nr:unknown [Clostridium sp. CAG:1193]
MCNNTDLLSIIGIAKTVLRVLQIGIPIILLIFGTIDMGKAVMAGDEKEIKAATNILIKRAVAAVIVFLLFMVVSVITGWVGGTEWKECWAAARNSKINTGL